MWPVLLLLAIDSPESKALDYLSAEVPRWYRENHCYSCHNNGDAARALMAGNRREPIADTLEWLAHPERWDKQQTEAAFRDQSLARIQFAFGLAEAVQRGRIADRAALTKAAETIAGMQKANGEWRLDQDAGTVGSPATYGTPLATYAAMRALQTADSRKYAAAIRRAYGWLARQKFSATPDLAARILAAKLLGEAHGASVKTLLASQTSEGAYGPYKNVPAEAFDTAIAMLALRAAGEDVRRARAWLIAEQLPDGGWTATTRPSGVASYAQHISTSGWATLALLATSAP